MPDAIALGAAIAGGDVSAREVMAASLAAIDADPGLGAVARRLSDETALGLAGKSDRMRRESPSPLAGVPFLAKDLGSQARGLAIGAGLEAIRNRAVDPDVHSPFFQRLAGDGGLVLFGLSTVPPMGLALSSDPAVNPFDRKRTPGGSSGGAAAAVAGGFVAMAHATDAAGSIRVPAAACGLWGLKPSRGATPMGPGFENHLMGVTSEGVVARSLRDISCAYEASSSDAQGPYPNAGDRPAPVAPKIGLCLPDRCDAPTLNATRSVADTFAVNGCEIIEEPPLDDLGARAMALLGQILSLGTAEWIDALGIAEEVPPLLASFAEYGREVTGPEVFAIDREMARISHKMWQRFSNCDAILMPVLAGPPAPVGTDDFRASDPMAHIARFEETAPNVALANVAGLPSLAIPAGMRDDLSVPVGVQLMGPIGGDRALLKLAERVCAHLPAIPYPAPIAGLPA